MQRVRMKTFQIVSEIPRWTPSVDRGDGTVTEPVKYLSLFPAGPDCAALACWNNDEPNYTVN